MTFQAIVFDNDGLLLDTEAAWTRAEEALFERHGSSFTQAHKRELIGTSRTESAVILERQLDLPGRGEALTEELHDLVMAEVSAGVPPRPGALGLLAAVRAAGLPVGLASNSVRSFVDRALEAGGLARGPLAVGGGAGGGAPPQAAPGIFPAPRPPPRGGPR